ncbi:hypothetical protein D9758_014814 [Tetrapyrgos nigripes]|uniref:Peptidase S53 domain-containing protein n=1 Tax=Tetrapyrgos nigripes TaxID=182062 RepID=A0A8H5C352_9AGAR|nr:hypothetical protein D9758_014814 [Tetrapyrgos nigripes]
MITLDCLRALYDIEYTPVSTNKNTFGIVEFTPQAYLDDDLDLFFALVGARPVPVLVDGAIVQTEMQNSTLNAESAGFDNWLDAVDGSFCTFEGGDDPIQDGIYPDPLPGGFKGPEDCGIIQPPNVVSISASQDESTATAAFANRQCAEYAKLGLMGTSVLYASGDFGVAGTNNACLDADGASGNNGTRFNPQFPATCPFVTAVGATQVNPGAKVTDPESACMQKIFSGGGFSNIFGMPDYQAEAVSSFLNNHPPPYTAEQFNNSGTSRGLPDISANGCAVSYASSPEYTVDLSFRANYVIGVNGQFHLVFGTSASAPVFASMITLLNDARIAAGKGPVGFVNPAVYSQRFKSAFNDITNGTNPGCGTEGFSATEGWDPVTGVGTPSLAKLMHLFLDLP